MIYQCGVFGNPIAHSLSPQIHQYFAKQFGINLEYEKILVTDFKASTNDFIQKGGKGFNITVPFKEDAHLFIQKFGKLSANAALAGAINTIAIKDGNLFGDNTDGVGLVNDLTKNIGIDIKDKEILIIGAGGASRGIIPAILKHNPAKLMIANRTATKALEIAKEFNALGPTCGFGLDKVKDLPVDIVINATSSSIDGIAPDIAGGCMNSAICYDLMYGKQTPFMNMAINNNAKAVFDGWGMLVEQAARAFEIWFDKKPDTSELIKNKL